MAVFADCCENCKPMATDDPALVGKRWTAGYDLNQSGLAFKSNIAGLQKATPPTETSAMKNSCHYHCPAACPQETLTMETRTVCISTESGIAGGRATWFAAWDLNFYVDFVRK